MRIELLDFVEGAVAARGVAVIIDVLRASSVACSAISRGAERIIPVGAWEDALELKLRYPEFFTIGERHGRKLAGFECGNSPTELERFDLTGRTVVHSTHSGTQGLVHARNADVVLTGSLVNAGAVSRYISALKPDRVSLVRMGVELAYRSEADDVCAELLAARLQGRTFNLGSIRPRLRSSAEAQKFFDPDADFTPREDFEFCASVDRFDLVLRLEECPDGIRALRRV
jgi:2-phosphosulfolactate phosphatase